MRIEVQEFQYIGDRLRQEDAFVADHHLQLYAVADGVGGAVGGADASQAAVRTLPVRVKKLRLPRVPWVLPATQSAVEQQLRRAFWDVHAAVVKKGKRLKKEQMATTLTAMCVHGGWAAIAHVGDSRAYRVQGRELIPLTTDHGVGWEYRRRGEHALADQYGDGPSNILLNSIGGGTDVLPPVDVHFVRVHRGDRFLLCTDGLIGHVGENTLKVFLQAGEPVDAAVEATASHLLALRDYRADNITALVITAV